jgi:glycosyltransferase involved in cell wall biosynthesis
MKILFVTPMPPQRQPTNAVPLVAYAQLTALALRHEVTLVTAAGPDAGERQALEEMRASGIEVQAIWRTERTGLGQWQRRWRLASAWLRGEHPWRTIWFWEPGVQRILDRLLAERQFDIIQLDDNAVGIYRYHTSTPIVFTEHEVRRPRPVDWHGWQTAGFKKWAWREADWLRWLGYQRQIWSRCHRCQVFSARDAEAVSAIMPAIADRVRVNPFGIVLPPAADTSSEQPGTIIFVGGFSHLPNVDAALWIGREIMPELRRLHPGVRLMIVGSYPPPEVQALAAADIRVTGRVPEVEPWLEQAAVVLAPVRIGGGMRTKVLQGMAMGKAVVTTPLGAEGLSTVDGGPPLAIAQDGASLARETAALLTSARKRRMLGARARAFVAEHFSAEAYVQRLEAIYAELTPGESHSGFSTAGAGIDRHVENMGTAVPARPG